jgi:predicted secreted protein with PEFG-CTERM motif
MKSKLIGSLFVVLTLVGIMAFAPSAFADATVTIATGAGASANAACVSTNNCFTPNPVNVAPGDTVTWKNTDTGTSHTVTSGKPDNSTGNIVAAVFDSSLLASGKTFSHTFTTADVGTINYFCQVHPWMTGQVIVGAASAPTTTTNATAGNSTATPEFGPIASLVLVIAVISVVAVTAKTRGFLKL